jgi:hypothetical protein
MKNKNLHDKNIKTCPSCQSDINLLKMQMPHYSRKARVLFFFAGVCGFVCVIPTCAIFCYFIVFYPMHTDDLSIDFGPELYAVLLLIFFPLAWYLGTLASRLPKIRNFKCDKCDWQAAIAQKEVRKKAKFAGSRQTVKASDLRTGKLSICPTCKNDIRYNRFPQPKRSLIAKVILTLVPFVFVGWVRYMYHLGIDPPAFIRASATTNFLYQWFILISPGLMLYYLGVKLPKERIFECKHCGWTVSIEQENR